MIVHFVRSQGAGGQNVNKGVLSRTDERHNFTISCHLAVLSRCYRQLYFSSPPPAVVNTKADLRFKVSSAEFLPQWVKDNLVVQVRRLEMQPPERPSPSIVLVVCANLPFALRDSCIRSLTCIRGAVTPQEKNRMNSDGELVIAAQRHRTQKCATLVHLAGRFF